MANNIIPECSANTSPDSMHKTLAESGCLVIHDIAEPDTIAKVRDELAETMASAPVEENDPTSFYAGKTRRAVALIHRSPTALELMMDARIEKLCDKHLLENCDRYHLNVTAAVDVGPGARDQILHREAIRLLLKQFPRRKVQNKNYITQQAFGRNGFFLKMQKLLAFSTL